MSAYDSKRTLTDFCELMGTQREAPPVLVAHRRRRRPGVGEERVACRFLRLAGEIVDLIDAIEFGLDDAGVYLPATICSFNAFPFGPPAISTSVGSQSREAKMSLLIVPA